MWEGNRVLIGYLKFVDNYYVGQNLQFKKYHILKQIKYVNLSQRSVCMIMNN